MSEFTFPVTFAAIVYNIVCTTVNAACFTGVAEWSAKWTSTTGTFTYGPNVPSNTCRMKAHCCHASSYMNIGLLPVFHSVWLPPHENPCHLGPLSHPDRPRNALPPLANASPGHIKPLASTPVCLIARLFTFPSPPSHSPTQLWGSPSGNRRMPPS